MNITYPSWTRVIEEAVKEAPVWVKEYWEKKKGAK